MGFEEYGNQILGLMEGIKKNRGVNPTMTLELCSQLRDYGEKTDDGKLLGFAYYHMGETYYLLNDVEQLFKNISHSLTYLENTRQHELIARAYNILAITSVNRGNAPFAMDYYLSSLTYCERYHLSEVGTMIKINIGMLYNSFGEHKKAQEYFEVAYQSLLELEGIAAYHTYLMNIYMGMGNCYLGQNHLLKSQEYEYRAKNECFDYLSPVEQTCFLCFQARLYHSMGKQSLRNEAISQIQERVHEKMIVLDVFDDFFAYCELLFEMGDYPEMMEVLSHLEELAKKTQLVYMQRRLLSIRIRYWRLKDDEKGYAKACAHYYELTEILEKENRYMVSSILNMRNILEETHRRRQEMEMQNRILVQKSETDALTGLANRFRLNDYSEEAFGRSLERKRSFAVEILDIDYFKQYNDNYGHQAGDMVIRKIAQAMRMLEQQYDNIFCARYGGDEFIIIYEGYTKDRVQEFAEELRQSICQQEIEHKFSKALPILTISQGICCDIPNEKQKVWDYLHTADIMLYKGKKISRNSVHAGYVGEE